MPWQPPSFVPHLALLPSLLPESYGGGTVQLVRFRRPFICQVELEEKTHFHIVPRTQQTVPSWVKTTTRKTPTTAASQRASIWDPLSLEAVQRVWIGLWMDGSDRLGHRGGTFLVSI